jgi:drug/metabolite transporter (DMT)-like permease
MTLGGILHLAQGGVEAGKLGGYLFALVLLGVLPSVGGSLLFERGLRRLPGPAPRRRSLPPA